MNSAPGKHLDVAGHRSTPYRLLLAACLIMLSAAGTALADNGPTMPMKFSHLTLDDGLSQSNIQSIFQDSQGYMWFATESGLNRYDGYEIKQYMRDRGNTAGLGSDFIWVIAEDLERNLWLATRGGGVVRWNRKTDAFDSFRNDPANPESLSSNNIRTLLVNPDGTLWVGTGENGLNLLDPATGNVQRFRHDSNAPTSMSGDAIYALFRDSMGQLWIGTDDGLNRMIGDTGRFIRFQHDPRNSSSLGDNRIRAIKEDSNGRLWVGTSAGGLHQLQKSNGDFIRYTYDPADPATISNNNIRAILEDDANRLWIATADGLNNVDPKTGFATRYRHEASNPESLNDSYINSLYQDRGGVLWVGTRSAGVSKWNPRSWSFGHYVEPWLRDSDVTSFATDAVGNVWIGTLGGGLARIDENSGTATRFRHEPGNANTISDDRVMSLMFDRDGVLWVGTMTAGLDRLDLATGRVRHYRHDDADPASLPADGVMTMFEDRRGNMWVGTYGGGIGLFDRVSGTFTQFTHDPDDLTSLGSPRASAILEDAAGVIWVGTFGGGLNRFDPNTGSFERFQNDPTDPHTLSEDTIYDLHLDDSGDIWIGTSGGGMDRLVRPVDRSSGYRFANVSQREGLPSNVVYSVQSDAANTLWLSTNYGLTRYDPSDASISTYHRSHGLQGEEFNFGAHHRSTDGKLYFGGANGFNAFLPTDLEEASHDPAIVLTAYQKLNQPVDSETPYDSLEKIELGHRDSVVTLEFSALDYTAPHRNRYAYMLEGFDKDWVQLGTHRRVTYTNLDAGEYSFRVKAATSDGVWTSSGLNIPVLVAPAPWQTWWAYTIYGAMLGLLLWLAWHSHRRKLQREAAYSSRLECEVAERTEELEDRNHQLRIASSAKSDFLARMSHEIRTPMNGMLGMTQLLMVTELDSKQSRFAHTIKQSAELLLDIINDILDFSKVEAGRLELDNIEFDVTDLVEETVDMFSASASKKGLELMCWTPSNTRVSVSGDPLRLKQVLANLLNNAMKFTREGEVLMRYSIEEEQADELCLRFEVKDTGIGIGEENQPLIFDSFSQEDGSTTRRFGGTGLGLAICKQLVGMMGGEIGVTSQTGQGSCFWFNVRLRKGDTRRSARNNSSRLNNIRVLVVDNNQTNVHILGSYLTALGIETEIAKSGYRALKRITRASAANVPFDVVLIDEHLGDMSGLELARAVRRNAELPPIKLVYLSPIEGDAGVEEWREAGVDDYLSKPVRQSILYECLLLLTASTGAFSASRLPKHIEDTELSLLDGHVLLVEDNAVNQTVAQGMLAELGCEVALADNGQQAVDLTATRSFDAVLMDCEMPVLDGFAATAAIQERERSHDRLPIIALTANAIAGDRERCLKAGMHDYISKPVTMESLHAALSKWLPTKAPVGTSSRISAGELAGRRVDPPASGQSSIHAIDKTVLDSIRNLKGVGGEKMVSRVISIYLSNAPTLVDGLKESLLGNDAEAIRISAHALKSSSQNVGAMALAHLSLQIEAMGRDGRLEQPGKYIDELDALYPQTVDALKAEIRQAC